MKINDLKDHLPQITVHGRFQPPLHINHWDYVSQAFEIADFVSILITNPNLNEASVVEAHHRNSKENNPFTYLERVHIFTSFFRNVGISEKRYNFKPFDIVAVDSWSNTLDPLVPNLVNTYGGWSNKKLEMFEANGYPVIHSNLPKSVPISGSDIRAIIREPQAKGAKIDKLIKSGYMPEAIPGLFDIIEQ